MNLQGLTKERIVELSHTKISWTGTEVRSAVSSMKGKGGIISSDEIKIGDVHCNTYIKHPAVIIKIIGENIYSSTLTTDETFAGRIIKCNSRFFKESWLTSNILCSDIEHVKIHMCGVYENLEDIKELKIALKALYKTIL